MTNEFKYTIIFDSQATGTGAADVEQGIRRVAAQTDTLTAGQTGVGKSTRNSAQALLMFSQGLEDAQYGIRGVLNNIPGLVMALGGGMGVAGAISIAAVAFSQLWTWFGKTSERGDKLKLDLDKIAENAGERLAKRLETQKQEIENDFERAEATKQNWTEATKAANAAALAQIDNAGTLAAAQNIVNDALGITVDRYADIEAAADRERQKLAETARQEAAAATRAEADAKANAQRQQDEWVANQNLIAQEKGRLENYRKLLEAARAEKAALERRANQSFAEMSDDFQGRLSAEGYWAERSAARSRLKSDDFQAPLKALQAEFDALVANIESLEREAPKMAIEMEAARTKLDDQKKATAETLEKVRQQLELSEIASKAREIQALEEQRAADLKGILDRIQPANETQRAAMEKARALVADNELTAFETAEANRLLSTLMQGIRAGVSKTNENISKLITEMQTLSTRQAAETARVDRLQREIRAAGYSSAPQAPR